MAQKPKSKSRNPKKPLAPKVKSKDPVLEHLERAGLAKDEEAIASDRHPWRLCPPGQHWVRTHDLTVPVSKKNPDGTTIRDGHCANNPSNKDQLYPTEIQEMAERSFKNVKQRPGILDSKKWPYHDPNLYDDLIAGWTQYWNEILEPKTPLDPNLVKALMASESTFNPRPKDGVAGKNDFARGLLQVTDGTRKILKDEKGELRDHLLTITQEEIYDPNLNICAGVRWLFQKRKLAANRLKRPASWEEAALEYKSYLAQQLKGKLPPKKIKPFYDTLKDLQENK